MNEANRWAHLAEQARAGDLHVEDETAARESLKACNNYIDELRDIRQMVDLTKNVWGFGDFPMAEGLRQQYLTQATGTPNSIDAVVEEHIRVAEDMRDVMAISIARLSGQDYTNAAALKSIIESG